MKNFFIFIGYAILILGMFINTYFDLAVATHLLGYKVIYQREWIVIYTDMAMVFLYVMTFLFMIISALAGVDRNRTINSGAWMMVLSWTVSFVGIFTLSFLNLSYVYDRILNSITTVLSYLCTTIEILGMIFIMYGVVKAFKIRSLEKKALESLVQPLESAPN